MTTFLPVIHWNWYPFQQLTLDQLYQLLRLRQEVFAVEQQCVYLDIDGLDQNCLHLLGCEGEQLIAYLRLVPSEYSRSGNLTVGRVVTSAGNRGTGSGKALMQQAMAYIAQHYPRQNVQIAAQNHLQIFYQKFGFVAISEVYDEDGIDHIDMLYQCMAEHNLK